MSIDVKENRLISISDWLDMIVTFCGDETEFNLMGLPQPIRQDIFRLSREMYRRELLEKHLNTRFSFKKDKSVRPKKKLFDAHVVKYEQISVRIRHTRKYLVLSKAYDPYSFNDNSWHRQYVDVWYRKKHDVVLLTRFDLYYSSRWRLSYDNGKSVKEQKRSLMALCAFG